MQELADMLHKTCVEETSAKEDDIANARHGTFADDDNFKCYIFCLMAQMACIEDDGTIDEDATIAVLPDEYRDKAAPIVRKCGTIKGLTPCESAWLTHKCYQAEAPDLTEDGDIDEDACIAYLADNYRDEFIPIIRRCGTKKGATVCDTAWLTNQCWAQGPRYRVL
ncbi:unnamed protein product [Acanthoscelides obtectus]|nr:unnamed protein product [Acanthoscelides obtectus]CAK1668132.1 General odorant-binding protein 83a [Acanthoscelides obtectus]